MLLEISGQPSVSLELGQLYLFGKETNGNERDSKNFIKLQDEENASKRHCVIHTARNEEIFVYDLFSFKGTLLNDKTLDGMQKTLLKNGDVLKVGNKIIKYVHQEHEMSCDSSGFLETQKNASDIISQSPESALQTENRLKLADDYNFLKPIRPSTSFSSRRSDSFAIPETQACKSRNPNDSNMSIAESMPNKSDGNIHFNFGNHDSFGDDDLCIPETQELVPVTGISSSQNKRLISGVEYKAKKTNILNEESLTLETADISEGSQFRICTQDYNEGFGEEETNDTLHSQIIPIIKHVPVILNKTVDNINENILNQTGLDQVDKEMSSLKWPDSSAVEENLKIRADCITPDIFEFEEMDSKDVPEKADKSFSQLNTNLLDEDAEDFLPTQRPPIVAKKVVEKKLVNEKEKSCLENDHEEVLTCSDKENRCPAKLKPVIDIAATQILEAKCQTSISHSRINGDIKTNVAPANKISFGSLLNTDPDEEDDLLTQPFLPPKSVSASSSSFSGKNLSLKCFNSTLLDDNKCTEKIPASVFGDIDKNSVKEVHLAAADVFKKPDKDLGILKKTSSASSTISENDIDLLMCTPQLIRDNLTVEKPDDLRKHILAVKNKTLFGDETEDEDEQNNLVKLINNPKSSLDFDQLLPHLNRKVDADKEEHEKQREAEKLYKFGISFGKEQEEKKSNFLNYRPSTYSRDERHVARDRERELSERKRTTKTHEENTATTKSREKLSENERENKKENEKNKARSKKKEREENEKNHKLKERESKLDRKTKQNDNKNKTKEIQRNDEAQLPVNSKNFKKTNSGTESSTRLRKIQNLAQNEKQDALAGNKQQQTPAKRLTRSKSRLEEVSPFSKMECKEEDMDSISTQPRVKKATRSKTTSNTSSKSNDAKTNEIELNESPISNPTTAKKTERKRKTEPPTAVTPAKIERKTLRSAYSQESLPPTLSSIAISITNVDQGLIKDLFKNCRGLWNIATKPADCNILVMDKPLRTYKFLLAMARGIPIVTSEYLKVLNRSKSLKEVNLKDYHFVDQEFEKKYKFSFQKSLKAAQKQKIFKDHEFLMTTNILPIPEEIKAIIEASGGYVHNKNPPPPKEKQNLYLVTAKEDKKDWHKYRRLYKNIIIVSTEAIMSAIMCQSSERMKSFILA